MHCCPTNVNLFCNEINIPRTLFAYFLFICKSFRKILRKQRKGFAIGYLRNDTLAVFRDFSIKCSMDMTKLLDSDIRCPSAPVIGNGDIDFE